MLDSPGESAVGQNRKQPTSNMSFRSAPIAAIHCAARARVAAQVDKRDGGVAENRLRFLSAK